MNKTLLLIALPSLLGACLEPNRMGIAAADDESSSSSGGDMSAGDTDADDRTATDGEESSDSGSEPASDESGESEESGESSDGPEPTCDLETHACISNVPDGWHGPVARIAADHPLGCHGDYETTSIQAYDDVFAEPAACTCECGNPYGGLCGGELVVETYPMYISQNEVTCSTMFDEIHMIVGAAYAYPQGYDTYDARFIADAPGVAVPGECDAIGGADELADPQYNDLMQVCRMSSPVSACDADTMCVPRADEPFADGVCIWLEGDVPCPGSTDFVQREVLDTGVVETRACSECSCGAATGEACDDATLNLWSVASDPLTLPADGNCHYADLGVTSSNWTALVYDPGDPSGGSCERSGGEPEGDVAPEGQITFCCA